MTTTAPVLSDRQNRIVEFIRTFAAENGYAPTLREIAAGVRLISHSSVAYQLGQLEEMGLLTMRAHRPRTLCLVAGDAS